MIQENSHHQQRIINSNIESLQQQSRSFSIPILNLDNYLLRPVMTEYNLNKSIDTIEDSLSLSIDEKKDLVDKFCGALSQGSISNFVRKKMLSVTPHAEQFVFKNYAATIHLFNSLTPSEKTLALSKTLEMAEGMKKFLSQPINTIAELNEYCYYVAGTVGQYLVQLLHIHHNYEETLLQKQLEQALGFGRFLQKLNIIRDFHEDESKEQGSFWPKEILDKQSDRIYTLNYLCHDTLLNDATLAIDFYEDLPEYNQSFNSFIKFILMSGLEYIKILKNNGRVFSKLKIKLPKIVITSLYKKIDSINKNKFVNMCRETLGEEINSYKVLLSKQLK